MTFTVTYHANGATGGSVPVDGTDYNSGAQVTVRGNEGNLTQAGGIFAYWNTAADGSGTDYNGGGQFPITADVTLYARWYITAELTGGGITTHYAFFYDSVRQKTVANPSGLEPDRTNEVIKAAEDDYDLMADWFGGIDLTPITSLPIPVIILKELGGASWGPPINLFAGLGGKWGQTRYFLLY